jgi:hypothetical protein
MEAIAVYYDSPLEATDELYTMEIPVGEDGRTQVVRGMITEDHRGREALVIFTITGEWSNNVDAGELLELNLRAPYVKIAKMDDKIIVCGEQLMESCQVAEVVNLVEEIASFGDFLEESLFGVDEY